MTTSLYSADIKIVATVYVKAANEREARQKIADLKLTGIEVSDGGELISGLKYTDPNLPDISLSPAMTIHAAIPGSFDFVETLPSDEEA